jgi:para-aminobenzoate synthetase/4-amino-4-deoxychorismate lyase
VVEARTWRAGTAPREAADPIASPGPVTIDSTPPPPRPSQPDPSWGVFETLLVAKGRPVELEAHLARLEASVRTLFDQPLPAGASESILEHAAGIELGRLRLTLTPAAGGDLAAEVVTAAVDPQLVFPAWDRAVTLRGFVVEGGLGAHKWADRRILAFAEAEAPDAVPLVLDGHEHVLEASRANVFVVYDGALVTPPTDGRILPGVARQRTTEVAGSAGIELREAEITLQDLLRADEVFLTGSVRGVEPVASIVGADTWDPGPVTPVIAEGLRQRWLTGAETANPDPR